MEDGKLHEETLKIAKSLIEKDPSLEDWVTEKFPELKESEDERIRKAVLKAIMTDEGRGVMKDSGFKVDDILSWLERGEQTIITDVLIKAGLKPYKDGDKWCVLVGDNIQDGVCGFGDTIDEALFEFLKELSEKQSEQKSQGKSPLELWKDMRFEVYQQASGNRHEPNYSDDSTKMFSLNDIDEIFEKVAEKQDEQKPADKIEPKFKVGDWVVYNRNDHSREIMQIYDIRDDRYYFNDNIHFSWSIKECDEKSHLWTIQDAKGGDVLEFGDHGRLVVGIVSYVNKTTGKVDVYCLLEDNNFKVGNYYALDTIKPHPANKEQCELLFQKMKESGYEWDAEKKELKKIEQSCYHNDGLYYAIDILEKTLGKVEGYQSDDGILEHKYAIEVVNRLYKQKPTAWTDKDWSYYNKLESFFEVQDHYSPTESSSDYQKDVHETLLWLKSLKDRVQPKQEWSEEDVLNLNCILSCMDEDAKLPRETISRLCNWLKSLKDRIQPQLKQEWGEEDEKALDSILNDLRQGVIPDNDDINWLKSLKERISQPHWKPSKEQLRAIVNSVQGLYQCKEKEILLNLYEQLKAL